MDYKDILIGLYYLLTSADNDVNEKEVALGKEMLKVEGISESSFKLLTENLLKKDKGSIYSSCLEGLKKLEKPRQIRCIAWLSVIANADGFMDKEEWVLIYKIYHTELGLPLDEVMKIQKELNLIVHGKSFQSIGVRVNK